MTTVRQPPDPPTGSHAERQQRLHELLLDARDRGDLYDERLVFGWIDDEYVSRAHVRATDREIVRLRRWFREAA